MKTLVEFRSTYDDDAEFSADGDMVVPGGRVILKAYRARLQGHGIQVSRIEEHSFYGWSVDVRIEGGWVWHMIQDTPPWLLTAEARSVRIPGLNAGKVDRRLSEALSLFRSFLDDDPKLEFLADFTEREWRCRNVKQR